MYWVNVRLLRFVAALVAALLHCSFVTSAEAAPVTWVGGNGTWTDGAANNANWSPADEPDFDDEAIFNTSNTVTLTSSNTVQALTMSAGIDLNLDNFDLAVNGLTQLTGASTNLFIGGANAELSTHNLTTGGGGNVELVGGTLNVSDPLIAVNGVLTINSGGTLSGNGIVNLDSPTSVTTLLNNSGTITALSRPANILLPPPVGMLTIGGGSANTRIDLDGSAENGVVNVNRNQTLNILSALSDVFNGTLNMAQNTTFNLSSAWTLGPGGQIVVDNGAVGGFPGVPFGTSTIAGATLTQSAGSTINVVDTDGTLIFDAPFTMNGGTLTNNGHVIFNANATIAASASFTMPTNSSSLTVEAGRTVTVNQVDFNPDGGGQTTNILTVNSGATLSLNMGVSADDVLSGLIRLNGGTLNVTTFDNTWGINGSIQVGTNTGISQISGEELTISNANVSVAANSTLRMAAPTTFGGGGSITGSGALAFNNQVNVAGSTTLNLAGGTVDLDGTDAVGDQINVRAPLVINTGTMASFGRTNGGGGVNTIVVDAVSAGATGSLAVNLDDPLAEWTLNAEGALNLVSTNAPLTMLSGNAVNLNGSVTVTGTAGSAARLDIAGTVNLQTAAPSGGLLLQGGTIAGPNRLEGGQINGPGALQALSGRALVGFGTINAQVNFGGTAELIAEGGLLSVNGGVADVGTVRVRNGATLSFGSTFNTNISEGGIVMEGGLLQGSTITTSSTDAANRSLRGFGTVSNAVTNSGFVQAIGGTLQLTNTSSDWDGAGFGHLRASGGGLLQLHGVGSFAFGGSVVAVEDSKVLTSGFGLNMGSASSLQLTQGTYESGASIKVGGTVIVGAGAPSTVKVALNSFLEIESTASVTLNGNLRLESNNARIKAGAIFGGNGAVVVPAGIANNLVADNNANINVLVDVQGSFYPGGLLATGRVDMKDYQQASTGRMVADLAGASLNQYDRLVINGAAQLGGTLEISLLGGFMPSLADVPLILIAAPGGVAGTFSSVIQDFAMPAGLFYKVQYSPTLVQLVVVQGVVGDYNNNGVVDAADYTVWRNHLGSNAILPNDPIGGTIGQAHYVQWQSHYGQMAGSGALGQAAVPEPGLAALLVTAMSTIALARFERN